MGIPMSTLGTLAARWAVFLAVIGGAAFYYWKKGTQRRLARAAAQRPRQERQPAPVKESKEKPKRQRIDDTKRPSYADVASKPSAQPSTASYSSDDDVDNREFARQLRNMQQGTKVAAKPKEEAKQRYTKQSRAQEMTEPGDGAKFSAPSSTAGIDADDDQSPAGSPVVGAVEAGGISDMLEKPAQGLSILKLTGTEEKPAKEKKTKAQEPAETKKQRQNRKKADAAKEAREEAEKERKVKLEAQRRLARVSEGRPAKDGSAFMAAQTSKNAWTGNGKANGQSDTNGFIPVQPLDTSDSHAAHSDASKEGNWMSSLPSEEEQMEMLRKDEEWSTVKTKARKPKKGSPAESNDEAPAPLQAAAPYVSAPAQKAPTSGASSRPTKTFNQTSSFAALSTEGPGEEEEEEWDVA